MTPLAVVSGATGGIGGVVARALCEAGYVVVALGRDQKRMDALWRWMAEHARSAQDFHCLCFDMAEDDEWWRLDNLLRLARHHDCQLTLMAACHGHAPWPIAATDIDMLSALQALWRTDVFATAKLCQIAGAHMIPQRAGSMVLLTSMHAHGTYPGRVPYSVAKTAVVGLMRGLAVEWGQYNIRVNAIAPGQTDGERTRTLAAHLEADENIDVLAQYRARTPLGRLVDPQDLAQTVLWLARTPSITGQVVTLDAGWTASLYYGPHPHGEA